MHHADQPCASRMCPEPSRWFEIKERRQAYGTRLTNAPSPPEMASTTTALQGSVESTPHTSLSGSGISNPRKGDDMFGVCRNTWRTLHALVVLILVTSAVMSSSTSARALLQPTRSAVQPARTPMRRPIGTTLLCRRWWRNPARPGPIPFLDLAVVQVAVHDAVQAIDRRFTPYHVTFPSGASGSPEAAAAKAAHDVLVTILPSQAASLDRTTTTTSPATAWLRTTRE